LKALDRVDLKNLGVEYSGMDGSCRPSQFNCTEWSRQITN